MMMHPVVQRLPRQILWLASMLAAVAAADADLVRKGEGQFIHCSGCHVMSEETHADFGPHLAGIVGRVAGAVAGYDYTALLRDQMFLWTEEELDAWLADPEERMPGMCTPFMGISRPENRRALIEFMKQPSS